MQELLSNSIIKGGLVLSIITAIGLSLKSLVPKIWDLILRKISYSVTIENKTELYSLFNDWLNKNHSNKFKKVLGKTNVIYKEKFNTFKYRENNHNSLFYFWYNKKLMFVNSVREKFDTAFDKENMHMDSYIITSYFSKNIIKSLLNELIEIKNNEVQDNEVIYLYDYNDTYWQKIQEIKSKNYDKIFNDEKKILNDDIQQFLNNKEYYSQRGIPYKRGYLLYGKPGNGKSTTILALAQKFNKDVYNLNLKSIQSDSNLKKAFNLIRENSFILIEDVDVSLNNRDDINKISFNTLLNLLDGALSKENVCVFFSTNHIEQIDPALLRCGRIDIKVEFKNPTKQNLINMLELFYQTKEIPDFNYNNTLSACDLQETCIEIPNIKEAIQYFNDK